jgi:hypothetical protein
MQYPQIKITVINVHTSNTLTHHVHTSNTLTHHVHTSNTLTHMHVTSKVVQINKIQCNIPNFILVDNWKKCLWFIIYTIWICICCVNQIKIYRDFTVYCVSYLNTKPLHVTHHVHTSNTLTHHVHTSNTLTHMHVTSKVVQINKIQCNISNKFII